MGITVVGTPTSTGATADVTSRAPAVPTGAAALDVAIVAIGYWEGLGNGTAPTITPPSGFIQKDTWTSGDGLAKNTLWWKRLTAADTGTYSFSWTPSGYATAEVILFRGCIASGDPFDGTPQKNAGNYGTFATLTTSTTDVNGALVWACYNDNSGTHTPPAGFTEAVDDDCGSLAYRIPGTAGSLSAASATVDGTAASSAGSWLGALLSDVVASPQPVVVQAAGSWPCF